MDKTLSRDGTPIAYRRRGDGPPVVLVGGALGTAADEEPLAALLEPRFTVFTYDRRGRGASGDTGPYAVRREIEDLAAVVARAGERVSVFGMLSGGALALEAQAAGVPALRLAVFEPPYTPGPVGRAYKARCTAELHALLSAGDRAGAVALHLARTGVPEAVIARMRRAPLWAGLEAVAPTLVHDDALLGTGEVPTGRFAAVTARTLVVTGGFSTARAHETTLALAAAIPRARHRTLTGQTRELAPHAIAPVLTDFFTRDVSAHLAS
ncbi:MULTISPECIES: alpha/beta fold hydrolase [Streptomyces]|uniref:alpha/beta fold hydrolase n=1 Tax=Streptomyces TaxID=1883 RepID=UPI00081B1F33|nr:MULTISPECIES: alpha/beta hydrolase [unclassified Streptomyces]MYQ51376.1 alpha/beta hydrolase [Streptomyces sp. SID4941]SCD59688.1 Lysophospholipase, alpha-beta hydrolase superfamily [Streptomyces sp. PalvLS-984]SDD41595.1 Lysophospholipase, alpha-beta hydrolase superfamily [Streptomyces sp. AmelKG-A3]